MAWMSLSFPSYFQSDFPDKASEFCLIASAGKSRKRIITSGRSNGIEGMFKALESLFKIPFGLFPRILFRFLFIINTRDLFCQFLELINISKIGFLCVRS